jgi:acyl carrier protein
MDKSEIIKDLCDFLNIEEAIINNVANVNYLQEGYVDSFGLIQLFLYIEDKYNINLNDKDRNDRTIFTINGLAEKIIEKSKGNEKV